MSMTVAVVKVKTSARSELQDITRDVTRVIQQSGIQSGICHLYVPHTTAGICINEAADPDVATDIANALDRLVPRDAGHKHFEGNADSHVKATLVGASETVLIENGRLALGRWQGIFFCEFDGPREREVSIRIISDPVGERGE